MSNRFKPGDFVIYRKDKRGSSATDIHPVEHGEDYTYHVDQFWTVIASNEDRTVMLRTRTVKHHAVAATNPILRHAKS